MAETSSSKLATDPAFWLGFIFGVLGALEAVLFFSVYVLWRHHG